MWVHRGRSSILSPQPPDSSHVVIRSVVPTQGYGRSNKRSLALKTELWPRQDTGGWAGAGQNIRSMFPGPYQQNPDEDAVSASAVLAFSSSTIFPCSFSCHHPYLGVVNLPASEFFISDHSIHPPEYPVFLVRLASRRPSRFRWQNRPTPSGASVIRLHLPRKPSS